MKNNIGQHIKEFQKMKNYWEDVFSEEIDAVNLNYDFKNKKEYKKEVFEFCFNDKISKNIIEISRHQDLALYVILVSALKILLFRLTGREDTIVAAPVYNVQDNEINNNFVLFRDRITVDYTFRKLLNDVKLTVSNGFSNQYYPIRRILEQFNKDKLSLLFSTMLIFNNLHQGKDPDELIGSVDNDITFTIHKANNSLKGAVVYDAGKYLSKTIKILSEVFLSILEQGITNLDIKITDIIIAGDSKNIIKVYNNTDYEYPFKKTIQELFEEQVNLFPDNIAVSSPANQNNLKKQTITYKELNEKANQVANMLRSSGASQNTRIGLLMYPSIDLVAGILAILKSGAAYLPLDPDSPAERLSYILNDSNTEIILTHNQLASVKNINKTIINMEDKKIKDCSKENISNINKSTDSAYVIYTSGSTGKPKGVIIEHKSLVNFISWRIEKYNYDSHDITLQILSVAFDGFGTNFYSSLLSGGLLIIPEEMDFQSIAKIIKKEKVTNISLVPSMYKAILEDACSEDIKSLKFVILAGEKADHALIDLSKFLNPELILINEYGPTENCITTTSLFNMNRNNTAVIGRPIANNRIYILDQFNKMMPVGLTGELCVSGEGLARGYINNPDLTESNFISNPFEPGQRMYKTGDLARWMEDGNIELIGRIDNQVKIRGFRVELGEIEKLLQVHPKIKEAVVIAREYAENEKYIYAYIVKKQALATDEIRNYLANELPNYMIPAFFIFLENMPLTLSGKIDYNSLPFDKIESEKDFEEPENHIEEKLVEMWKELLHRDKIGISDNFFNLGGHSFKAATLITRIHKILNVEVPIKEVFATPTIKELAKFIMGKNGKDFSSIQPAKKSEYYPVSSAQKRLFILDKIEGSNTAYNIPGIYVIEGDFDKGKFEKAVCKIIERHDAFRTSFVIADGTPVQEINSESRFKIKYKEISNNDNIKILYEHFVKPFNLGDAPLLRIELLKESESKHFLFFDTHHIVADGVSLGIFIKELISLYNEEQLPELKIQYKDFAVWQNTLFSENKFKNQKDYWLNLFKDDIPVLNLPLDFPRPASQSFEGDNISFTINREMTESLNTIAGNSEVTLFMLLLALYVVLLSRYSNQEDIVVGTPIAGRRHADVQEMIGIFVNTIPVRCKPESNKGFSEFLIEVRESVLAALENQDYPFEELVEEICPVRDLSRNPLFDVMFGLINMETEPLQIKGLKFTPYEIKNKTSKFEINLSATEEDNQINFQLEYNTKLFQSSTINRIIKHFKQIISAVCNNPDQKIMDIDMLSRPEKDRILYDFNELKEDYDKDKTIMEIFEDKVRIYPDNVAVVFNDKSLTYSELNSRANQLAELLRDRGVKPETIVGIMAERSLEMIIGIFGILKAGGAYLPVNPEYPEERINFIFDDSNAGIILTQQKYLNKIKIAGKEFINLEDSEIYAGNKENPTKVNNSGNMAYVIYTSGSTGKPKGVVVEHLSVVNLLCQLQNKYPLKSNDQYLLKTTYTFDVSVAEIFGWFFKGGKLIVLKPGAESDPLEITNAIDRFNITHINFVPSMLSTLLKILDTDKIAILNKLKYCFVAGEAISCELVDKFKSLTKGIIFENIYGPTEATVYTTAYSLNNFSGKLRVPIGKPMANINVYILAKNNKIQPAGIIGELCISGDCIARGYLNRPELTNEKFVENPFESGKKMYRTGDLARWLPDGNIEFFGRMDQQIKLRGYRIEIGEIESHLQKHEKIDETVVINRKNERGETYLCAYYTANVELEIPDLHVYLSKVLPDYMIPSFFIKIDSIPINYNGKVDRKALPEPESSIRLNNEYKAPATDTEKRLLSIWQEVLGFERISVNDNFFELGGNSLSATILISKIKKEFNIEIEFKEIFKYQTIKGFSELIESFNSRLESIIKEIENMPDDQVLEELNKD